MTTYELHQRTVVAEFDGEWNVGEVIGEVQIPEEAIGVNTVALESAPPIVTVSWLEP